MPGDAVRVVQPFNDGWAFVEQIQGIWKGSQGLIPIDCLKESGQDVARIFSCQKNQ